MGTVRRAMDDLIATENVVTLRRRNGVRAEYQVVAGTSAGASAGNLLSHAGDLSTLSPPFQPGWKGPSREVVNG
jgi:hypothetical protein